MVLKGIPSTEINAYLDESFIRDKIRRDKIRVLADPIKDNHGRIFINVRLISEIKEKNFVITLSDGEIIDITEKTEIPDYTMSDNIGFLSSGSVGPLLDEVIRQIAYKKGSNTYIKKEALLGNEYIRGPIQALEQKYAYLLEHMNDPDALLSTEQLELFKLALDCLKESKKIIFDAVVLSAKAYGGDNDQWLFGFNSKNPVVSDVLEGLIPGPVLGYSREAIKRLKGEKLEEYILHEALCGECGHYKAREIQEILYSDTNYSKVEGQPGKKDGAVTIFLRTIMKMRIEGENIVYPGAFIDDKGNISGSKTCEKFSTRKSMYAYIDSCSEDKFVIKNIMTDPNGGLMYKKHYVWASMKGYENTPVTIEVENGKVTKAYYGNKELLYPVNILYADASVDDKGVRIDGEGRYVSSFNDIRILNRAIRKYFDRAPEGSVVVENVKLNEKGGMPPVGDHYFWDSMRGYAGDVVTVFMSRHRREVYDSKSNKIYPKMVCYEYKGLDEAGTPVRGEFVGCARSKGGLKKVLDANPGKELVITEYPLTHNGGFHFFREESYWSEMKKYNTGREGENHTVTVVAKGTTPLAVYGEEGEKLYPSNENIIYLHSELDPSGKRSGGTLWKSAINKSQLSGFMEEAAKKYPGVKIVIENFPMEDKARCAFNGRIYKIQRPKRDHDGTAVATIEAVNGLALRIYDERGELLYVRREKDWADEYRSYFDDVIEEGFPARGDGQHLFDSLAEQIKDSKGRVRKQNILRRDLSGDIKSIRRRLSVSDMPESDRQLVDRALEVMEVADKVEFNAVILDSEVYGGKEDHWLFRFDSQDIQENNALKGIFNGQVLGYSRELVQRLSGDSLERYLLYAPLCRIAGREKTGEILGALFENIRGGSNSQRVEKERKAVRTLLRTMIKIGREGENLVYIDGRLDGKGDIIGGRFGEKFPRKSNMIAKEEPLTSYVKKHNREHDIVIKNFRLSSLGAFNFLGRPYVTSSAIYQNELVNIFIKKGSEENGYAPEVVYTSMGDLYYPFHVVYVDAGVDGRGNLINGEEVARIFDRDELNVFLRDYTDRKVVVKNVPLNNIGGLEDLVGESPWFSMPGYENAIVTVCIDHGEIKRVYGPSGNIIYPSKNNRIYYEAYLDDAGKRTGGVFWKSANDNRKRDMLIQEFIEKFPESRMVVDNFPVPEERYIVFNGEQCYIEEEWLERDSSEIKYCRVEAVRGLAVKICDANGNILYERGNGENADEHSEYLSHIVKEGFASRGNRSELTDDLMEQISYKDNAGKRHLYKAKVIKKDLSGEIESIRKKVYLSEINEDEAGLVERALNVIREAVKISFNAVILDSAMYRGEDHWLFWFNSNDVNENEVLQSMLTAPVLGYSSELLDRLVGDNRERYILHAALCLVTSPETAIRISDKLFNKDIDVDSGELKNREDEILTLLRAIIKIKAEGENLVYIDADMDGKGNLTCGRFLGAFSRRDNTLASNKGLSAFIRENNDEHDIVIKNFRIGPYGNFFFLGKSYALRRRYGNDLVNILLRKNSKKDGYEPSLVYTSSGELFYPRNVVYVNAHLDTSGKRVGGEKVGSFFKHQELSAFLREHKDGSMVVENIMLNSRGGFPILNDERHWNSMDGYGKSNVTAYYNNGKLEQVYTADGRKLYPFNNNIIHSDAVLDENGRIVGGTHWNNAIDKKELNKLVSLYMEERPGHSIVVDNFSIPREGDIVFYETPYPVDRRKLLRRKGETLMCRIEAVDGVVRSIFSEDGVLLYKKTDNTLLDRLIGTDDFDKLIQVFGIEGASRILLSFIGDEERVDEKIGNTGLLLKAIAKRNRKRTERARRKALDEDEIFLFINSIQLFKSHEMLFRYRTVEELKKLFYKYMVRDHRFLEKMEKAALDPDLSAYLKGCYEQIIEYYRNFESFDVKNINTRTKLKFYQKIGVKTILDRKKVILADEPGLGKTLQVLAAAANANNGKGSNKCLIICPKSAKKSVWEYQIKTHLRGNRKVMVINDRKTLLTKRGMEAAKKADFLILSYGIINGKEAREVRAVLKGEELGVDFIVIDEAHRMRNDSQLTASIFDFDAEHKVLVTGTPLIGRDPKKLFNFLQWISPEEYTDYDLMRGRPELLREEIKKYMLRRHVSDVFEELPGIEIEIRKLRLHPEQLQLYREVEDNIYADSGGSVISKLSVLKRAAVDSALIKRIKFTGPDDNDAEYELMPGKSSIVIDGITYYVVDIDNGSFTLRHKDPEKVIIDVRINVNKDKETVLSGKKYRICAEARPHCSAKYDDLDNIVKDIVENKKEKIVIFTGMVGVLNTLAEKYGRAGYKVRTMHGRISSRRREELLKEFNASDEPEILISTYQTGGESVDITGAAYGVIVDEPWTFQERDQIVRRLARMGQKKHVKFFVLQSLGTIDERIEVVMEEGRFLQELLIDGNVLSRKDVIRKIMKMGQDGDKASMWLKRLKERMEDVDAGSKGPEEEQDSLSRRNDGIYISFEKGEFKALLEGDSGEMVNISTMHELIGKYNDLSGKSRRFLKDFILTRMQFEIEKDVPVKDMIIWDISEAVIPGMEYIDYDGRIETLLEVGTYIIYNLAVSDGEKEEELIEDLKDMPGGFFEKSIRFMAEHNLFNAFSFLEILPHNYRYDENLLKWNDDIKIYYRDNGIRFYDMGAVKNITYGVRVPEKDIPSALSGFRREANMYRDLMDHEEKKLAYQAELGNNAAEEVLILTSLKRLIPIAQKVKRGLNKAFSRLKVGLSIEEDELWAEGRMMLMDLIRKYAETGAYEKETLKEYIGPRITAKLYSWGRARGEAIKEIILDEQIGEDDNGSTRKDMISDADSTEEELEEDDIMATMERLMSDKGFNGDEIVIIKLLVIGGYTADEVAEMHEYPDEKYDEAYIREILERFRTEIVEGIGLESFMELVGSASASGGGFIISGDKEKLFRELAMQILDPAGKIEKKYEFDKDIFGKEIEELEALKSYEHLDEREEVYFREAIEILKTYNKIKFDAIVRESETRDKKDSWLLGFAVKDLNGYPGLVKAFDGPVLGYATDVLGSIDGDPRLEYLLHEPLCSVCGHYKARIIQEKLFKDSNYRNSKGHAGRKDSVLSDLLRGIINRKKKKLKEVPSDIKRANEETEKLFFTVKGFLDNIVAGMEVKDAPVEIIVEQALFDAGSMERDCKVWADLIVLCKDLKDVSFVFTANVTGKHNGATAEGIVLSKIRDELTKRNEFIGSEAVLSDILRNRIYSAPRHKENIIKIPFLTRALAENMSLRRIALEEGTYPVVLDAPVSHKKGQVSFRDYVSALLVGLSKAVLVKASRNIKEGVPGAEDMYDDIKDIILKRLNGLYSVIRGEENPVTITERVLEYMIADDPEHRLNRAVDLYIPAIGPVDIDILTEIDMLRRKILYMA